ncbi:hypothetical protein A4X13_0g3965 [Tilletia indica]|uniref:Saccharopine dehydrogenase NADP binding domain-containing protein n=1 Tax=Tilletia indica TaxID=43049 RepID=A0A177TVU7_9BASI|nr:hypothetical protein A4X13_0g3965 [Tilletia indica]
MPVYDLVVAGATGFVGKLVVKYLVSHPEKPTFAIAGRSRQRLEAFVKEFNLDQSSVGLIEVNTRDPASVQNLVSQARVIINLAGPYHAYGAANVVKACAESERGVGYVDLTGESFFYRDIIKYHATAKKNGSIIIPSAGFDSIPFDLSVYLGVQAYKKAVGGKTPSCLEATMAWKIGGGISKGTISSLADIAEFAPNTLGPHPADLLSPIKGGRSSNPIGKLSHPALGRGAGMASPFLAHNGRIILRSAALLERDNPDKAYGKAAKFHYHESMTVPYVIVAYMASFILQMSTLFMRLSVGRWLIRNVIPDNSGPSQRTMENGFFSSRTVVRAQQTPSRPGAASSGSSNVSDKAVLVKMGFKGDPGYLTTAKMVVEMALLIAEKEKLPESSRSGGIHTAASVSGELVAERFTKYAGFEITTEEL